MKTFTQMKESAAAYCGVYTNDPEMIKIVSDMQTGVKLFQNAARRYWTRRERKTNIVENKQYYQFPSDMLRVVSVKIKSGNTYTPISEIVSEDEWDVLNTGGTVVGLPYGYFVRGSDEVGLYPIPKENIVDGLIVVFEPRMNDMAIEDKKFQAKVIEGSNVVEAVNSSTFPKNVINNCWMQTTDGSDGNWYKVVKWVDPTHIWLDNYFQGLSDNNVEVLIGQCPQFPEEFHDAPVHYACQLFFTMRKDLESASFHGQQFDKLFNQYRRVYGIKTDGGVINSRRPHVGLDRRVFPRKIG